MNAVTRLQIQYRVVTPAFLGGADVSHAELRPPSIKAALRFWYRAVDPEFSRRATRQAPVRESLLFGATENGAGQSKVLLAVLDEKLRHLKSSDIRWDQFAEGRGRHAKNGLTYLGYPLRPRHVDDGVRTALAPDSTFTLRLVLRPGGGDLGEQEARGLISAAWLLGHLGGLGARSRRGFGSLALDEWSAQGPDAKPLDDAMRRLPLGPRLQDHGAWERAWTGVRDAFQHWFGPFPEQPNRLQNPNLGPRTRSMVSPERFPAGEWPKAMDKAGRRLQDFRSRRKPDYNLVKAHLLAATGKPGGKLLQDAPPRVTFGLPLSFRYSSLPRPLTLVPYTDRGPRERMGSLLFVRILQLRDGLHPAFFRLDGAVPGFDVPAGQRSRDGRPLDRPASCALDDFMGWLE
jgi:CRISPR-associated protein Cmr1